MSSNAFFRQMQLVTKEDYLRVLAREGLVRIAGRRIRLRGSREIPLTGPPENYAYECDTVWSFPDRGRWATHDGEYPGNWSPYVPRNLIERFTVKNDVVLDPMMGSGTTLVECRLLHRNAIGVDVNYEAVILSNDRSSFSHPEQPLGTGTFVRTYIGDARNLDELGDESIDLVATHPPYASIIRYGEGRYQGDLSEFSSLAEYVEAMGDVAMECFRVLKRNGHCGILVGDTRAHAHYVPISFFVMARFLAAGFILKEDIIKIQYNTSSERGRWRGQSTGFYKIAHEHLFVFRKPRDSSEYGRLAQSTIQALEPQRRDSHQSQ